LKKKVVKKRRTHLSSRESQDLREMIDDHCGLEEKDDEPKPELEVMLPIISQPHTYPFL